MMCIRLLKKVKSQLLYRLKTMTVLISPQVKLKLILVQSNVLMIVLTQFTKLHNSNTLSMWLTINHWCNTTRNATWTLNLSRVLALTQQTTFTNTMFFRQMVTQLRIISLSTSLVFQMELITLRSWVWSSLRLPTQSAYLSHLLLSILCINSKLGRFQMILYLIRIHWIQRKFSSSLSG